MKITIEAIGIEMTEPLETFIESKFSTLEKLVAAFDDCEMRIEISRSTKHQKKGEVYCVAADLRIPGKILRAEEGGENIRTTAIKAKDVLKLEIEKYKSKFSRPKRDK